jgi:hypothetical protein
MARSLSLLAGFASPVFLCAAIAGWLLELWPANPLTLAVAAVAVIGGPLLGIFHVATASGEEPEEEEAPTVVLARPAPAPFVLTPRAAAARRFANWRDTPNEALTQRERERRATRYLRG